MSLWIPYDVMAGGVSTSAQGSSGPQSLTTLQKLSLPGSTPLNTIVHVTDGLKVAGAGTAAANGFYALQYSNLDLNPQADPALYVNPANLYYIQAGTSPKWVLFDSSQTALYHSNDVVSRPWQITTWVKDAGANGLPVTTNPAVQQYTTVVDDSHAGVIVTGALLPSGENYSQGTAGYLNWDPIDNTAEPDAGYSYVNDSNAILDFNTNSRWAMYSVVDYDGGNSGYQQSYVSDGDAESFPWLLSWVQGVAPDVPTVLRNNYESSWTLL